MFKFLSRDLHIRKGSSRTSGRQSNIEVEAMPSYNHVEKNKSIAGATRVHHRSPIRPFFCCGSELSLVSIVELHERKQAVASSSSLMSTSLTGEPSLLSQSQGGSSMNRGDECPLSCQHCGHNSNLGIETSSGEAKWGDEIPPISSPPKSKQKKLWSIKLRGKLPKRSRYTDYRLSLTDSRPCYSNCSVEGSRCINFATCEHHLLLTRSQPSSTSNFLLTSSRQLSPSTMRIPKGRHHWKRHSKKTILGAAEKQHHRLTSRQFTGSLDSIDNVQGSAACAGGSGRSTSCQQPNPHNVVGNGINRNTFWTCHNFCAVSPSSSGDQLCSSFQRNCSVQGTSGTYGQFSLDYCNNDNMNDSSLMDYPPFNSPSCGGYQRIHSRVEFTHCLVPDLQQIANCSFYWGVMDRYEAEKLLENKAEGTFLLRDSAQEDFLFSVSFRRYGRSLHARIEQWNHKFSFDSHDPGVYAARTVCRLIEHYKDPSCCMFFEPMLTRPLNRTFPFSLQHLCRAAICSITTYDKVTFLPLPSPLKNFLKYYHYKMKVNETILKI